MASLSSELAGGAADLEPLLERFLVSILPLAGAQAGAVRVRSFVALFSAAKCLASRYRPVGRRLAIITNGGGPGVLAADWISEINLQLGCLTPQQAQALQPQLSPLASLCDLMDLAEDAGPEHFRAAIEAAGKAPQIDGVLAIYSPKVGTDGAAIASALADAGYPSAPILKSELLQRDKPSSNAMAALRDLISDEDVS